MLSPEELKVGLATPSLRALDALKDPSNVGTLLYISIGIFIALALNFFFRRSWVSRKLDRFLEKGARLGPFIVRIAISASFFFSAYFNSFLGPELPLSLFPNGEIIRVVMFAVSFLFLAGFLTELASLIALIIYITAFVHFGFYLTTYLNYVGELIALLFLGFRYYSVDGVIFGAKKSFAFLKKYESAIVRICYGLSLCYSAIYIKFFHSLLPIAVVNNYNLTQFTYLFPHDPLLVALGASLAELMIGLFIVFGFELRLTAFVSLIYITLSLLFFKELVWPHFMLYGISLNLIFNKETFTLDRFFDRHFRRK